MLIEITVLFCYVEKLRYSGKVQMGSGREAQGREDVYTRTADSHCTAETQHCEKTIVLQFEKNRNASQDQFREKPGLLSLLCLLLCTSVITALEALGRDDILTLKPDCL